MIDQFPARPLNSHDLQETHLEALDAEPVVFAKGHNVVHNIYALLIERADDHLLVAYHGDDGGWKAVYEFDELDENLSTVVSAWVRTRGNPDLVASTGGLA